MHTPSQLQAVVAHRALVQVIIPTCAQGPVLIQVPTHSSAEELGHIHVIELEGRSPAVIAIAVA